MGGPILQEAIRVGLIVSLAIIFLLGFMIYSDLFLSIFVPVIMAASIVGTVLLYWLWPDIGGWTAGILVFSVLFSLICTWLWIGTKAYRPKIE